MIGRNVRNSARPCQRARPVSVQAFCRLAVTINAIDYLDRLTGGLVDIRMFQYDVSPELMSDDYGDPSGPHFIMLRFVFVCHIYSLTVIVLFPSAGFTSQASAASLALVRAALLPPMLIEQPLCPAAAAAIR